MTKYQQLYCDIKSLIIEIKNMSKEDSEKLIEEVEELADTVHNHLEACANNL